MAGISLARALGLAGVDTLLLDAGGFEPTMEGMDAYRGTARGTLPRMGDAYPHQTRLRYFGGTSNHWSGWCRPFSAVEMAPRAGLPESGWPLDPATLNPWYRAACDVLDIGPFLPEPTLRSGKPLRFRRDADIETLVFGMSPPTRLGMKFRTEIVESEHARLALDAPVVDLRLDGTTVGHAVVAGPSGRYSVKARRFVLAAGGIENARILLGSTTDRPKGLGNEEDLVGRYFADHPEVRRAGMILLTHPSRLIRSRFQNYRKSVGSAPDRVRGLLATTAAFQNREGVLAAKFVLAAMEDDDPEDDADSADFAAMAAAFEGMDGKTHRTWLGTVDVHLEPAPNRASRVTLTDERDALGMRRVLVDWRLHERDVATLDTSLAALARELGAGGVGRLKIFARGAKSWRRTGGGQHHMGTTRMAESPRAGVVGPDAAVHGIPNLFVAGSSVFPSFGAVNPTLTITALALRLADHLTRSPR